MGRRDGERRSAAHMLTSAKVARADVKVASERMVWSSDWPHPTEHADAKPDDAILFDLLANWAPGEAIRNRILVDNPVAPYGFD
jgi:predicted TIM-barrel fold metal-dependent hydrolase